MKKKLLSILLTMSVVLGIFAGCGGGSGSGRPRTVTLAYMYGGYGSEYWDALAEDFMENYDSEIELKMKPVYDTNLRSRIQSGKADGDIVYISVDMFNKSNCLEKLDDIYELTPLGEEQTIGEKVGERFTEYYREEDGIYQFAGMPAEWGFSWVYNKTVLDEAFGEGNWTLPRTTDDFFEFGDTLFHEKDMFLTSAALADTSDGDYLVYAFQNWFAQLMGLDAYDKFFDGLYNDNGEWKLAESGPLMYTQNRFAIESAYSIAYRLGGADNNYLHSASENLNFTKNNIVFAGGGFGSNRAKTAFLYTGPWFEMEIAEHVADGTVEEQVYGVMKSPVPSDIVELLEYRENGDYMSDEKLSLLIKAIDENAKSFDGVSEKDFNKVKEARNMVLAQICTEIVVPTIKDESKREDIIKVLRYLATDNAQKVAAKAVGGVKMFSFGYNPDYEELGITPTNFISDFKDISEEAVVIDYACVN